MTRGAVQRVWGAWVAWQTCFAAAAAFVQRPHRRHRLAPTSKTSRFGSNLPLGQGQNDDCVHGLSDLRQTSYDALLNQISPDVKVVLIGEGTHGTEEFFCIRSEVTRCLLQHQGFDAVLCEGDVQPFFELNRFVTESRASDGTRTSNGDDDASSDDDVRSMLSKLFSDTFPDWMWSNVPMADFVSWLRMFNRSRAFPIQMLGMDVQSPFESIDHIIRQLSNMGEEGLKLAKAIEGYFECLSGYRSNIRDYGNHIYGGKMSSQENAAKKALDEIIRHANSEAATRAPDTWFRLIQSGHAIVSSEAYHRQRILPGHTATWNLRTEAMMGSILRSMNHIGHVTNAAAVNEHETPPSGVIVWAHNSHVGDMRSTGYSQLGQTSLGQLCREKFGDRNTFLIGMTTYEGSVRAAQADKQGACWRGRGEVMTLKQGISGSQEHFLHTVMSSMPSICGELAFGLDLQRMRRIDECLGVPLSFRPERFVGSCYLPHTEMMSHYSECDIASQFDYVFHVDKSSALNVT